MKKLLSLLTLLLFLGGNAFADTEYTVSLNNGATQTPSASTYFTVSGSYNTNYTGTYGGTTYTKGLKLDSSGKVTFTNTNTATVTIVQSLSTNDNKNVKFNGANLDVTSRVDDTTNKVGVYTISNVSAGSHTIEKGSGETGILYVKVVETESSASPSADLGAPDYTNGYTWNFTNINLSNITVGGLWAQSGSKYANTAALSNVNLIKNGDYIEETKYLTFSSAANYLWISNTETNKYLSLTSGGSITIPDVPQGKIIVVTWFNASGEAVTANVTGAKNFDATTISTPATANEVGDSYLIADGDGNGNAVDVTITIAGSGKFGYFQYIRIMDPVTPTVTLTADPTTIAPQGTSASTLTATYAGYNVADQYTVTYSSSNTGIATVDASTGVVTGVANGIATITATLTSNNGYYANTKATCEVTVKEAETSNKTISVADMRFSPNVNREGLNASWGLDRTLGGFAFTFTGADGVKYNNSTNLLLRASDASNTGIITITPQKTGEGTIKITKVIITTNSGYTGSVKANDGDAVHIDNVSSYTFDNLTSETFTLKGISGQVYIESFQIYYTDPSNVLSNAMITPTITWSKASDNITSTNGYSSPTITTTPANFDIDLASNATSIATVPADPATEGEYWNQKALVTLIGTNGSATITASATNSTFYNAAENATYTITLTPAAVTFSPAEGEVTSGTTVTLATETTGATIYYTTDGSTPTSSSTTYSNPIEITAATTIKAIAIKDGQSGSVSTAEYTISGAAVALTPESDRIWKFDEFTTTSITTDLIENNMRLVGTPYDMVITSSSKTYEGVKYTSRLQFKGQGSAENGRYIQIKVTANSKVSVWGVSAKSGENRTLYISGGSVGGGEPSSLSVGSDIATLSKDFTEATDVYIYASSAVNIYGVKVEPIGKTSLTRFSPKGGQYTTLNKEGRTVWPNFTILYTPTDAGITSSDLSIDSSDPSVLGTNGVTFDTSTPGEIVVKGMSMGEGGTATMTLSFAGNTNYNPASTDFTLTVEAPGPFRVIADDQEVQKGQFTMITPVITDKNGNKIGIKEVSTGIYTTYILDEEEDIPDYSDYFDFTFANGDGSGTNYKEISVDETGKVVTESTTEGTTTAAEVGAYRNIKVTATPKPAYQSIFSTGSASQTATSKITIIAKTAEIQLDFFWDAKCTKPISSNEYTEDDSKLKTFNQGIFTSGFPNGRMIYAKIKDAAATDGANEIWFSYAVNGDATTLSDNPSVNKKKGIYQYRRGVPIYVDENFVSGTSYVTLNIVAAKPSSSSSSSHNLYGTVARFKFPLVTHDRPDAPTYSPVSPDEDSSKNKDGRKIMDTSENVVATGENGNLVYGKFSTSSVYTTEQLINEETVSSGETSVPVVSTEVAKRRFTTVQIRTVTSNGTYGYGEYISPQSKTEYWYLYDTRLSLTPAGNQYINVLESTTAPTPKVVWYNKKTPGWQDVDTLTNKITYEIYNNNGATGTTINATTGVVTAGENDGWVRVRAYYVGGEEHGGKSGEPQYVSTTAPTETFYYVYISDPSKEVPEITPPSRNFTSTQTYKIKAPTSWDVYYTIDGSNPDPSTKNGTYLKHGGSFEGIATATTTVKAIAYNPNAISNVSRIVSETYTKVDPLPDPVFNPDGVPSPYYYYTNSLTVQIACAYAGSVIYYTVDGSTPEIGAEGTYKYSGLEKVVISGNTAIKAIAHDPVRDIYSHVVTSNYIYTTDMTRPYFQVSTDGTNWQGLASEGATTLTDNGTFWYSGESITINPTYQIRIVDPNNPQGTIYYTIDGTVPSESSSQSLEYNAIPFTVAKTTTGSAVVVLDEASSKVSTARFVIDSSTYPVWEAVQETTPNGTITKDAGFVISTNKDLVVTNSKTKVNLNSLSTTKGGTASKTYAQQYITATFGGYEQKDWSYMSIADDAIGTPIDNIGTYSIKTNSDALLEAKDNTLNTASDRYNHAYSNLTSVSARTFKLPTYGNYVRFEPERDGDLTLWVLQQGSVHYEDDEYLVDRYIRLKPIYLIDEQGNSIPVKVVNNIPQMWSTARLTTNWNKLQTIAAENSGVGGWANYDRTDPDDNTKKVGDYMYIRYSDGAILTSAPEDYSSATEGVKYKRLENKGPNRVESKAIYDKIANYISTNNISIGDPIKPFAIHNGTTITLNNNNYSDSSNDGTGYILASGGYAKYTFPVKAGKTYFFLAQSSKVGIRGFQFVADTTEPSNTLTIKESGESNSTAIATAVDARKTYKTTGFDRELTANTWTTLVLPFSISATQLEQVFGEGTDIMHFNRVEGTRLYFYGHWHRMIVAGTPVFIKPTKTANLNDLDLYVQVENKVPEIFTSGNYTFLGYYDYGKHLNQYDYYISKAGNFCHWTNDATNLKSTRAVLHNGNGASGAKLMLFMEALDEIGETTGIEAIYDTETGETTVVKDATIYNVSGQVVRSHANSLDGLPKGIYIVNGKKYVVE